MHYLGDPSDLEANSKSQSPESNGSKTLFNVKGQFLGPRFLEVDLYADCVSILIEQMRIIWGELFEEPAIKQKDNDMTTVCVYFPFVPENCDFRQDLFELHKRLQLFCDPKKLYLENNMFRGFSVESAPPFYNPAKVNMHNYSYILAKLPDFVVKL